MEPNIGACSNAHATDVKGNNLTELNAQWFKFIVFVNHYYPDNREKELYELFNKKFPHLAHELNFLITGSTTEDSSRASWFKQKWEIMQDLDVMIYLKSQLLSARDEECLLYNAVTPGFVQLKLPHNGWTTAFNNFNNEYSFTTADKGNNMVVSTECVNWTRQLANIFSSLGCESWQDIEGLRTMTDRTLTQSGPSVNISRQYPQNWWLDIAPPPPDRHFIEQLYHCYTNCVTTSNMINEYIDDTLGGTCQIDWLSGIVTKPACIEDKTPVVRDFYSKLIKNVVRIGNEIDFILILGDSEQIQNGKLINSGDCDFSQLKFLSEEFKQRYDLLYTNFRSFEITWEMCLCAVNEFLKIKEQIERLIHFLVIDYTCVKSIEGYMKDLGGQSFSDVDFVFSIKCNFWPSIADGWLSQTSISGFPPLKLKQSIKNRGVFIVPKSYQGGNDDLDWRFSFSKAELELSKHRLTGQKLAYFLFKCIYYEQLHVPKDNPGHGTLSSYHIKTITMWACEEKEQAFWDEHNVAPCVLFLLHQLIVALEKKYLQHYFLSGLNLLGEARGDILKKLLVTFKAVTENPSSYPSQKRYNTVSKNSNIYAKYYLNALTVSRFELDIITKPLASLLKSHSLFNNAINENMDDMIDHLLNNTLDQAKSAFGISGEGTSDFALEFQNIISVTDLKVFPWQYESAIIGWVSVLLSEMNATNLSILHIEEKRCTFLKCIKILLEGKLHIMTYAMCRKINYTGTVLEMLTSKKVLTYLRNSDELSDYHEQVISPVTKTKSCLNRAIEKWNTQVVNAPVTRSLSESERAREEQEPHMLQIDNHDATAICELVQELEQAASSPANPQPIMLLLLFRQIQENYENNIIHSLQVFMLRQQIYEKGEENTLMFPLRQLPSFEPTDPLSERIERLFFSTTFARTFLQQF